MALTRSVLRRAALLVDRSGLAGELDDALFTTEDGSRQTRGRPRALSIRTLLLGLALCAIDNRELHLVRARQILSSLSHTDCRILAIPAEEASRLGHLTDRQVSYLWCRIISVVDPSPHFSKEAKKAHDALDTEPGEPKPVFEPARLDALQSMLDRLLEASLLDIDLPDRQTKTYAVDWTYVESWARLRRATQPSPDPDASHIYITARSGNPKYNIYGYKLHAVIRTRKPGQGRVPYLAERITLTPANVDPQTQVMGVVRDLVAEQRIDTLISDRGYTFSKAERWALPLKEMGVEPVLDLHPDQRSTQGSYDGALMIDGGFYCPAMPQSLHHIERLDQFAKKAEREKFFADIERRQLYEFRNHGVPGPGKPQRMKCPAAAGVIRCPLKPASQNLPYTYPTAYPDPGLQSDPPTCCAQTTISVPVEIQANTRQKLTWGTREWFDVYGRLRPSVESFFGLIKDPGKEHMSRGRIKMMGLAKTSVMVAFWAAAANLRLLDAFEREQARLANAKTKSALSVFVSRTPRRRRALSLAGRAASANAPPRT